ncbi:MAG: hypothetical protein A2020_03525 [Lentisphaerae bacterium GWF2_45_14]|nr:MAG: hypothetical protein A2020_03525 [Lentisphaerae bacterium GWF2_45_14]
MKKTSSKTKTTIISIAAAASLVAISAGLVYLLTPAPPPPPDPVKTAPEEIAGYVASTDFAKMPLDKKVKYMENLRNSGTNTNPREIFSKLSAEERKQVMENMQPVMREIMRKRVKEYFALKTQEEKDKFLDGEIERMRKMRAERPRPATDNTQGQSGTTPPAEQPGGHRPRSKDEIKKRIETSSPEDRAQFTQYMKDMRARRHR